MLSKEAFKGIQSFSKYLLTKHSVPAITLRAMNIKMNTGPNIPVRIGLSAYQGTKKWIKVNTEEDGYSIIYI